MRIANCTEYGLVAGIWSQTARQMRVAKKCAAARYT